MIIDVYAVGVLHTVQRVVRAVRIGRRAAAWRLARSEVRRLAGLVRERRWRTLRSTFNGYLAEPTPLPDGLVRCGRGWTRRAAVRDLERQIRRIR